MDPQSNGDRQDGGIKHPYLHDPRLYISALPNYVTDENLAMALMTCGPFRPKIDREDGAPSVNGIIEFKFLEKAEKALATLHNRPIPGLSVPVPLLLSPYPQPDPPTPLPPANAIPRVVKSLPPGYTDSQLYDLFRPYGALASVRASGALSAETGMVEFWDEDDAKAAEEALHCADVDGQNIVVQIFHGRRSNLNSAAPVFQPTSPASMYQPMIQYSPPPPLHRDHGPYGSPRSPTSPIQHGPGQQVQVAPPGSNSHSGLIDPCNLFCKNLDSSIDSNALFHEFRRYGQIVSARVMRNENGESRGFGFVSYQAPDQAARALQAMNGCQLGNKQIVVRLHEPKQLRQEKLAARFNGHHQHPRSSSGATSPTLSEAGESMVGWTSPRQRSVNLGSPGLGDKRGRRGSGSYYNAALSGNMTVPTNYNDLASLSPTVRKDVLAGHYTNQIRTMELVEANDVETIVDSLVALSLSETVTMINDADRFASKVGYFRSTLGLPTPPSRSSSASMMPSRESSMDPSTLAATASAPEYPSTPISGNGSISTPPRTSSPSGSALSPAGERERMLHSVKKFASADVEEVTDLLMQLSKRERAMCFFNESTMRQKISEAKALLELVDDDEPAPAPVTPQKKRPAAAQAQSPVTPGLSSGIPSVTSSPAPATPGPAAAAAPVKGASNGDEYTAELLGQLPLVKVVDLVQDVSTSLSFRRATDKEVADTRVKVHAWISENVNITRQNIGKPLNKLLKQRAPTLENRGRVAIQLLETEDAFSLGFIMELYPDVLIKKAGHTKV
ncbi:hypothetical protein CYLTODRAFT_388262 [Cylindrobasidium torrendii FP15055 ss-10]|uniref:RRM domain-containing protein n=1 Tax=Cylindrobasidium torrendii FP15055 ss-10 TaxID=1314674 RepID=A0A0D7BRC4_9AGAR|nr:hypothetical protein CYLTODRAFT_388262 [Cylindrobasidium torrendii FP15055 ss-10]